MLPNLRGILSAYFSGENICLGSNAIIQNQKIINVGAGGKECKRDTTKTGQFTQGQ